MSTPDFSDIEKVVFDTEPIIAYLTGEDGSDVVEEWFTAVADGKVEGYITTVTKTEVVYVALRAGVDESSVSEFIDRLTDHNIREDDTTGCWFHAALYKNQYNVALGDAFALASAHVNRCAILVGADDDFDELEQNAYLDVHRFRDEPA